MCSRVLQILLLLLLPESIRAALKNVTIDDTNGDPNTGAKPTYLPDIWQHPDCSGCAIKPPLDDVYMHTYSALTYMQEKFPSMSIQFSFHGSAIWVYFILANFVGDGVSTETLCNFTLDGDITLFHHIPTTSPDYDFNSPVFSKDNLPNKSHTLLISTSGVDRHVFTSFDYAIYQFDDGIDNTTSQPSPTINRVTITDAITTIDSGTPIMMTISSTVTQSQPSSSFSGTISSTPRSSPNSSPSVTIITSEILGTLQTTGMLQTTGTVLATSSLSNSTSGSASTNTANDITAHKPPTGAIAGGVVGGAVLILILNLFFVIWRRKRRAYMDLPTTIQEPKPSHLVLTPFTASSPADPTIETRTTEGVPFTSVRNQQDVLKMHVPQHHHSPSSSATPAEITRAHHQRTIDEQINEVKRELDGLGSSASGPSRSGGSDVTEILQQNQAMKAEIERLQAQLNSDLALGLIDGAPPEYSTHATDIHRLSSRAAPVAVS